MIGIRQVGARLGGASAWPRALVGTAALLAVVSIMHMRALHDLVDWWGTTSKYGHSLLVIPIVVYLLLASRKQLGNLVPAPAPKLLALLLLQAIALGASYFVNVKVASLSILLSMYPVILWSMFGTKVVRAIYMPLLLLMTLVPAWELLEPMLTKLTAVVASWGLNLLGIPVFRDDQYLAIPEGVFEIEQGCGGFRYFIVGLTLGMLNGYWSFHGWKRKAIVITSAVAISVIANWVRVMIVIWAGHLTNMQHHFVHAHVKLGWYVFAVAFLIYFVVSARFASASADVIGRAGHRTRTGAPGSAGFALPFIAVVAILVVVPVVLTPKESSAVAHFNHSFIERERSSLDGWTESADNRMDWSPRFNGAAGDELLSFRKGDFRVDIYFAYYVEQREGQELVNLDNTVINSNWLGHDEATTQLVIDGYGTVEAESIRAATPIGRQTVWTWYYVSGYETPDPRMAKLFELKKMLGGVPISAVFAVRPAQGHDDRETKELTEELLSSIYPRIISVLTST